MGELLVLADEHTQLVVVNADVIVKHLQWQLTFFIYIFKKERENHIGVVHRSLAVCL